MRRSASTATAKKPALEAVPPPHEKVLDNSERVGGPACVDEIKIEAGGTTASLGELGGRRRAEFAAALAELVLADLLRYPPKS